MQLFAVRPDVTRAAFRDVTMLGVTAHTLNLAMLAGRFCPLDINLFMAGVTSFGVCVFCKLDLQWLMNGMTFFGTALEFLSLVMGLVAGVTAGNEGVRRMAIVTCQLGMFAGEFL